MIKKVPKERDPQEVQGSPDAGIAPEWPSEIYNDEHSAVTGSSSSDETTGHKAPDRGESF